MGISNTTARQILLGVAPGIEGRTDVEQGVLGIAQALSNYGYRFAQMQDQTDNNWGGFLTPPGVPCAPPQSFAVETGGGKSICVLAFDTAATGVAAFVDALDADPGVEDALLSGDLVKLTTALAAAPAFAPQVQAFYQGNLNFLANQIAVGIRNAAHDNGQPIAWKVGGVPIDQAIDAGGAGGDLPTGAGPSSGNNGVPDTGGGTTPQGPLVTDQDEGLTLGKGLGIGLLVGLVGIGLYEATRGARR